MACTFDDDYRAWRDDLAAIDDLDRLFVVGCVKSGTTWLMNVLNGHPEIVVRGEGCFTYRLGPMLAQAFKAFNEHQKAMGPVVQLRDLDLHRVLRTMIDSQFARYIEDSGKDRSRLRVVGDKTPQHTISLPMLAQLCAKARFIHIMRDPRDMATSAWHHFGPHEGRSLEDFVRHYITQVWPVNVGNARKAAPMLGDRYVELRYEDLHEDERGHIRRILRFLGVDAADGAVDACQAAGDFRRRAGGRRRGESDASSFYRSGTVGDWQNHLPVELVQDCCERIAPLMEVCGYDPACAEASTA